ncbi:hypothetical protein E0Z10_g5934 [Xylaria hypoxylon]|uniref:Very-long-chain (3R)-3-hydroxyacyl-CoA dehydratase n=1 Tax=Xylaria hypoxylon TaxID=37992 RepID=A0A4Z0YEW3_9PEZI|nr:hypothetical protein E0Z10_g5934 [Xylaria hypoxylon]
MPPRRKKEPRMTAEKTYLIVYNSLALLASEYLILRAWNCDVSPQNLYAILDAVTVLQSFMVLEILHAALRDVLTVPGKQLICKAHYYSLTVLRIGGRHFIIWFVMRQFTLLIFKYAGTTFLACLLCWGCFDFLYYARAIELLLWGNASSLFVWLRLVQSIRLLARSGFRVVVGARLID